MNENLEIRTLKKGTVVKINGIPLALVSDTEVATHPNNYKLVFSLFEPECSNLEK